MYFCEPERQMVIKMGKRSFFRALAASEVKEAFPLVKSMEGRKRALVSTLLLPPVLPLVLHRYFFNFTLPYVELVLTPRCNLKCAGCANLMPCYDTSVKAVELETLKKTVEKLLQTFGRITELKLIGGEPFLYAKLGEIVDFVVAQKAIKKVIITTNGSVVPKEANLKSLINPKVVINISEYPIVDSTPLVNSLKQNGIQYEMIHFTNWMDYGKPTKRNYPEEVLQQSFNTCASAECKTILNGKLFCCPRDAHGQAQGLIPSNDKEFVDLLNSDPKTHKRQIKTMYARPFIAACDYCTPVWERPGIECGVQLP
jgi:organic radical activating enzyme